MANTSYPNTDYTDLDLSNTDFTNKNLDYKDYSHTNFTGCLFKNTSLKGVNFSYSNLTDVSFINSNYYLIKNIIGVKGNGKEIQNGINLYQVNNMLTCITVITAFELAIGSYQYTHSEWANFTKDQVLKLSRNDLLLVDFWLANKHQLLDQCYSVKQKYKS